MKNKAVWALLLGAFVYWKYGDWGVISIDKALFLALAIGMLAMWSDCQYKAWKYDSPQIITPNEHGSTDMRIIPAGQEFVLVKKGGILTAGWHSSGGDGTYVLPTRYVYAGDQTIITSIVVTETDLYDLPPVVHEIISQYPEFKPPYYYGRTPLAALDGKISVTEQEKEEMIEYLLQKEKMLNRQINWTRKRLQEATMEIDNLMSHYRRATEKDKWYEALYKRGENSE